ncbi:DUF6503 family protein [Ekhidna sp. To15]|uniref:DUF6503 family protein n=1 Tax=Ekhidna sp. To15 TaxID=3395267 RepID=UPI003F520FA5
MKKIAVLILFVWSCGSTTPTAQQVVDKAINASGTQVIRNASATFTFRNIRYEYQTSNGRFTYTRIQSDSLGNEVKDVLTNDGLKRFTNNEETNITEEKRVAYTSSVNSVIYFAFLPSSLNDAAVNKTLVGTVEVDGRSYYKIKVTFDVEGGGEDYEDVFYYWFDTVDYSMDYLAYSYNEDDGKGIRFRVAYNSRKVNGVTMQDYRNLKPIIKESVPLLSIDQAYQDGKLEELSLIELEDVVISIQ